MTDNTKPNLSEIKVQLLKAQLEAVDKTTSNADIHYAPLVLDGDIPVYHIKSYSDVINFTNNLRANPKMVYLIAGHDEIVVSEQIDFVVMTILEMITSHEDDCDEILIKEVFHVQEYTSFEEAYEAALDMKETSSLCYKPD